MSDIGRNIRRIAKTEELERRINDLQQQLATTDKSSIDGSRSTAYKTANGGYGQQSGDTDADQLAEDIASGLDDFEDGVIDIFGDESGNQDGTGEEGTPTQTDGYEKDLNDLLGTAPILGDLLQKLSGLEECSGSGVGQINMDGFFQPQPLPGLPGDTPNGETTTNPRDEGYVEGGYHIAVTGGESYSPYSAAEVFISTLNTTQSPTVHTLVSVFADTDSVTNPWNFTYNRNTAGGDLIDANNLGQITFFPEACDIDVDSYCPSEPTLVQWNWDADGIHQLAFDGAQFKTSEFETPGDIHGPWDNDTSKISGCTSSGESVTLEPTGDGGANITFGNGNQITTGPDNRVITVNY